MAFAAPITIGSLAWGTPVNDSLLDLDARLKALRLSQTATATDQNLVAWAFDPATNLAAGTITTGSILMVKIGVREAINITNVIVSVNAAGVGLTAGQNFVGLYDGTGVRLGQTVDQTANWGSTGVKEVPLTAPVALLAGTYLYVAVLANGGTSPSFARGSQLSSGPSTINVGLTASNARYATSGAGVTSLPANITMAARTQSSMALWAAMS